ncbi:MAG: hypothetical protein SOX56_11195 [[Pasteurella] mairii]|uniref:6-phosphofructokinase n=1 Tax=[Pasteurella] mairii TaxID=757 RepID=A0A379B2F5_9PAST|nr:hypothetical protein [[Pasteurella] mairii]SUB32489.1 Uncharacterised protein [[Pasteurella] mairii]
MKKIVVILTALLLSACSSQPQLSAPKMINHGNKSFYLALQQDLGKVGHYMYLKKEDTLENWQSAVELLLDRSPKRDFKERIALRKKVYKKTGVEYFKLYEKNHTLYSYVIYAPSARNKNWQVDVAKGKNIPQCGFVQYQYSLKVAKNKKLMNMNNVKIANYLKRYVVDKELKNLMKANWNWGCGNE